MTQNWLKMAEKKQSFWQPVDSIPNDLIGKIDLIWGARFIGRILVKLSQIGAR